MNSLIRGPFHSSLAGGEDSLSYVVSSSSETQNALRERRLVAAHVGDNSTQDPQLNHQPMGISLMLHSDTLPKLPISTEVISANLDSGRHSLDSCTAAVPDTPSLCSPMAAPSLQASLMRVLNEPSPLPSPNNPGSSVLRGHERSLTVPASLEQPESVRQRLTTGSKEMARQRSIHGTKLITSYFSPSQSPKTIINSALPNMFASANAPRELEISTLQDPSVTRDAIQSTKRLLPAFSEDVRWQPQEKRVRLDEYVTTYTEFNTEDSSHPEAMQTDDDESRGATRIQAMTPAEDKHHPPLQSPEDNPSLLDDKQSEPDLFSPLSKAANYESQVEVADEMIISDDEEGFLTNSASFEEYDPYFDTLEVRSANDNTDGRPPKEDVPQTLSVNGFQYRNMYYHLLYWKTRRWFSSTSYTN